MAKSSPTQKTLKFFRDLGLRSAVTEKFNSHAKVRQDLFGWCDGISLLGDESRKLARQAETELWITGPFIIGWQTCAGASHAARRAKMLASDGLRDWLAAGGVALLISWSKKGPRGARKAWTARIERITLCG